ncbi:MAG: hypothetical protein CMD77_00835 [Gammaproteobacteria bacterium]|nr:hypothetical protein [Gammaproteobacteria bacterium]
MAAQLEDELGISTSLEVGSGGVFDVWIDDRLVFSKSETGNFPDERQFIEAHR